MAYTFDKKTVLKNLIPPIIKDQVNLKSFVFFLNRLENLHKSTNEIQSVLNDYLSICHNYPLDKQSNVKHLNNRDLLYFEENIGFLNAEKIEIIATAVLKKTSAKLPVSIFDFKRRYKNKILRNDLWGEKYRTLINEFQEGDRIWEIVSSRQTWKQLCGSSFVVLVREDEQLVTILKSMN